MKVFLVATHDPAWHPSTVHTAQLFSETGASVDILCRANEAQRRLLSDAEFGSGTRLQFISRGPTSHFGKLDYVRFILATCRIVLRQRPDCIIGYDLAGFVAAYVAWSLRHSGILIYHNFDLTVSTGASVSTRFLKCLEGAGARRANCVLVSSEGRGEVLREEARLVRQPIVVKNCQRMSVQAHAGGELDETLRERGLTFERLVVRLGSLGPHHGIEATIRSVSSWRGNWGLVLAGAPVGSYLEELEAYIDALDLGRRIVLLPDVTLSLWHDCLYRADLGIALYETGNINHGSMAGAGNKLNLYLKAGIPSIVPRVEDFEQLTRQFPVAALADPTDPDSIAEAINSLLLDPEKYALYCRNAKRAFEVEFNFEKQFDPVVRLVVSGSFSSPEMGRRVTAWRHGAMRRGRSNR